MGSPSTPITQDLVLIGGGHSHAIALRRFAMQPIVSAQLTLITDVMHTPYSGMLPGYVAGLYGFDECHIDLQPLAKFAGARLIHDRAIGLDLAHNRVLCAAHPAIAFDRLSLDLGSTPAVSTVPGAKDYAIPVKPISQFLQRWDALIEQVQQRPHQSLRLVVVGGGAGGVELALAVQARLQRVLAAAQVSSQGLELHLIHSGAEILPERSSGMRRKMQRLMTERGIRLHLGERVSEVGADWVQCESELCLDCDHVFWVTQASATTWLYQSGLATDERGFVQVNDCLQSTSHPQVFAAGDVATMRNHPRPKAGVFAVRQGQPLEQNLRRSLLHQPLQPFVPQRQFLILVGLGNETAVASRGVLCLGPTGWLWRWKDRIDWVFMNQFADLAPMMPATSTPPASHRRAGEIADAALPMHCAGCGSKVGGDVLGRSLTRVRTAFPDLAHPDVLIGLDAPDDAAVVQVPPGRVLVQTVDYFRALVDDPYVFGQIVAHHCLNDLFAMGAAPQSALAIATLPYAPAAKLEETLVMLLLGVCQVLQTAGATLMGGHTVEGADLALGLTCNGLAAGDRLWHKGGMQPEDVLILTKPLGTGTLFAADMQHQAKGRWIEGAIASMLHSNQAAVPIFQQYGATACTDVTGFGLLGHLAELLRASHLAAEVSLDAIPVLEGASETIHRGLLSSIHPSNATAVSSIVTPASVSHHHLYPLLVDPQTSGGLLASVPQTQADACLQALKHAGFSLARRIGQVRSLPDATDASDLLMTIH
ncbi:MAG: selenide, water dikinase SelD [Kaiparowitsia implicata GSE-PSE-MK54-09C]|nr:selenide, water dikinase SelD [Kaiparowitsia implicata GSE-PSE-MK54-09C]